MAKAPSFVVNACSLASTVGYDASSKRSSFSSETAATTGDVGIVLRDNLTGAESCYFTSNFTPLTCL